MRWGLTGGIATGKSTVAQWLTEYGAAIVDADRIARELTSANADVLTSIVQRFGTEILNDDGSLNRKALGSIIFHDPLARVDLQNLLHPMIRAEMRRQMDAYEKEYPHRLIIADIPLLYESNLVDWFDGVLVVYTPRSVQAQRLITRDAIDLEQAHARLAAQLDIEEKKKRANWIIDNSGSLEESRRQLDAFWQQKGRA